MAWGTGLMLVYHGTTGNNLASILDVGILPRGGCDNSNWNHSIESNPDTVYLTTTYPVYFALQAMELNPEDWEYALILEVDTDLLDQSNLVPDEDALEQESRRGDDGLPKSWDMKQRTRHYRGMTREFAQAGLDFFWSLENLGTGGHFGRIHPAAITRYALIDIRAQRAMTIFCLDAQITVNNFKYASGKYRNVLNRIFDKSLDPEDEADILWGLCNYQYTPQGIEVIVNER